jgi:hypothetical protein
MLQKSVQKALLRAPKRPRSGTLRKRHTTSANSTELHFFEAYENRTDINENRFRRPLPRPFRGSVIQWAGLCENKFSHFIAPQRDGP